MDQGGRISKSAPTQQLRRTRKSCSNKDVIIREMLIMGETKQASVQLDHAHMKTVLSLLIHGDPRVRTIKELGHDKHLKVLRTFVPWQKRIMKEQTSMLAKRAVSNGQALLQFCTLVASMMTKSTKVLVLCDNPQMVCAGLTNDRNHPGRLRSMILQLQLPGVLATEAKKKFSLTGRKVGR